MQYWGVEFYDYKDSVMRVAGILQVPTMHSKDILLQAKWGSSWRVHSDQMVLEMIRWGRLVGRAVAQWRVEGTFRLPLQWDSSCGGQMGGQGAKLKDYSHREPTQRDPPGSSTLRSDGSHGGQAWGGSGRAVVQRRPKTVKGRAGKQL